MKTAAVAKAICAKFNATYWGKDENIPQVDRILLELPTNELYEAAKIIHDSLPGCRLVFATGTYANNELYWLVEILSPDNTQLSLRVRVGAAHEIRSLSGLWEYIDWQEKEAHELFGITFLDQDTKEPFLLRASRKRFPHRRQ